MAILPDSTTEPQRGKAMGMAGEAKPKSDPKYWRLRRWGRNSLRAAAHNFYGAWLSRDNIIASFIALASSFILAPRLDEAGLIELGDGWVATLEALGLAVVLWVLWCVISAPVYAWCRDRRLGTVYGNRFEYKVPLLVFSKRCRPTGQLEMYKFKVADVERGAFIHYSIDIFGPKHLAEIDFGGTAFMGPFKYTNWPGTGGTKLPPSNEAIFRIRLPVQADAASVRIYCHAFSVGNPDDKAGDEGNYKFPIRSSS